MKSQPGKPILESAWQRDVSYLRSLRMEARQEVFAGQIILHITPTDQTKTPQKTSETKTVKEQQQQQQQQQQQPSGKEPAKDPRKAPGKYPEKVKGPQKAPGKTQK